MTTAALERLVADGTAGSDGRAWLDEHGWPGPRDEMWRYSPLPAITSAVEHAPDTPAGDLSELLAGLPPGPKIVLVDGAYRADLSDYSTTAGITVETGVSPQAFFADPATDGFAAANHDANPGTTRVRVTDAGTKLHIVHLAAGGPAAQPRTEVSIATAAQLELIETFRSAPGARLTNAVTVIDAGDRSRLDHLQVFQGAAEAASVARLEIVAREGAVVRAAALAAGPGPSRQTIVADFAGSGSTITLTGLSIPAPGSHHDTTVSVRHKASHATSRQLFVSIVPDGARSSFTGHVSVAAGTSGTDADQQNRNLLLGPTARADTRPWLQIDAEDVACTHGATVGRLDEDGVFYLRSRGIPERAARTMLVTAFAQSTVGDALPPGPARFWLTTASAAAIDAALHHPAATAAPPAGTTPKEKR